MFEAVVTRRTTRESLVRLQSRPLRTFGPRVVLALLITGGWLPTHAQLASPISSGSEGRLVPGELVWADLVTTDVEAAVAFYSNVFGWQRRDRGDPDYVELARGDELVGAVAAFEDDEVPPGGARWLVSISVKDVDETARQVVEFGGSVLEVPYDLPDRGRLAVVSDDQGAMLILLRAAGGDPLRSKAIPGAWAWAELWTRDIQKAVAFYEQAIGYRAVQDENGEGQPPVVLTTQGEPRATVVEIPWEYVEPNWLPYVLVADGRQTLQRILDSGGGVLFTSDDVAEDTGTFAAIVSDPTGGVFAIQELEAGQ
jgi:predicted enzyme related to lactoylglutathione lyase